MRRTLAFIVAVFFMCTLCSCDLPLTELKQNSSVYAPSSNIQAGSSPVQSAQPAFTADKTSYCYSLLTDEQQLIYEGILTCVQNMESSYTTECTDDELLVKIFHFVISDHPELFWVDHSLEIQTHLIGDSPVDVTLEFDYLFTAQQLSQAIAQVESAADECLSSIDASATDYDKIKQVYDWVILRTSYIDSAEDQSLYSVMTQKQGVCSGYARTVQYLLHELNIPCTLAVGTAGGQSHIWNVVQADGQWYHLDATWGDSISNSDFSCVSYAYFCTTTAYLSVSHSINSEYSLPDCTAFDCNYFRRNNLYLEQYDPDSIRAIILAAVQNHEYPSIQFAGAAALQTAADALIESGEIFPMLKQAADETDVLLDTSNISYFFTGNDDTLFLRIIYQ